MTYHNIPDQQDKPVQKSMIFELVNDILQPFRGLRVLAGVSAEAGVRQHHRIPGQAGQTARAGTQGHQGARSSPSKYKNDLA